MKISAIFTVALTMALLSNAAPLEKRRFGQEHSAFVEPLYQKMRDASQGTNFAGPVGQMSGEAVNALLAAKPACRQQVVADHLVFFAKKMGADTTIADGKQRESDLIDIAKQYRTAERNTNQDGKPSLLCGRNPAFKELNGILQAQDPAATTKPDKPTDAFNLDEDFDPVGVLSQIKAASNNGGSTDPKKPKDDPKKPKDDPKKPKDDPKKPKDDPKKPKDDPKKPKDDPKKPKDDPKKPKDDPKNPTGTTGNEAADKPLGGVQMPLIKKNADGTFGVNQFTFQNESAAHDRQCAIQHNACANGFNVDKNPDIPNVGACDTQETTCKNGPSVFA